MALNLKAFFSNNFFIASALAASATAGFYLLSDKVQQKETLPEVDPMYAKYVSAYTSGLVSSEGKIRVVLAQNVLDSVKPNVEGAENLFDFDPDISGKAVWIDQRTVEFIPTKPMESGELFAVNFELAKVAEVREANMQKLQFGFRVIPQFFEFQHEGLKSASESSEKKYTYFGKIITADVADNAKVEELLGASLESQTKTIKWEHAADKLTHRFSVENIERQTKTGTLTISWNGDPMDIENEGKKEIEIPALGDFRFLEAIVTQEPEQFVTVKFSDPLSKTNETAGLLDIQSITNEKYTVEGNEVKIYPTARLQNNQTLFLYTGITSISGKKTTQDQTVSLAFEQLKPAIRLVGSGVVVPSTNGTIFPFEAVGLKAVEVRVDKIFENNMVQFLQQQNINSKADWRVSRPVLRKTIYLGAAGVADFSQWKRYTLDLSDLIKTEPGAIYQVSLSFNRKGSAFPCTGVSKDNGLLSLEDSDPEIERENASFQDGSYYYNYGNYDYSQTANPCHDSYYQYASYQNRNDLTRNVLASDLGLIAKQGKDGVVKVIVTHLKTTEPMAGVEVELFDAQQQWIATTKTDNEGIATIQTKRKALVLVAKKDKQRGYLRLNDGSSLSLSSFDVSGGETQKGLKGFIYGERGVWRPGDSLYLTFVLEDKAKLLPRNHPISFELQNPQGQTTQRLMQMYGHKSLYTFATITDPAAPTGEWQAIVKVGGAVFSKTVKIETVKPNRLKVALDFGKTKLTYSDGGVQGTLKAQWLTGAKASGLKARYDAMLSTGTTVFDNFKEYVFDDPMAKFEPQNQTIFEGYLDGEGFATVNAQFDMSDAHPPGALNVNFKGKVFEQGGDFSVDNFTLPYYPYESFVGMLPPATKSEWDYLYTDTQLAVQVATVNANGTPTARADVKMELYKLDWRWWWDQEEESSEYTSDEYMNFISSSNVSTGNDGKGVWKFEVKSPDWGRFFIRATDPVSGHTTGKIVYIDSPYGSKMKDQGAATRLQFFPDKGKYKVGEKVKLTFASNEGGKALVSLENGTKVIKTFWVKGAKDKTTVEFEATAEMSPNVFAHIHFIQPHAQQTNDLPIRLYGISPIMVEDPKTKLEPIITMPDVLKPEQNVTIKVAEKNGKPMMYTIAVVDEGLLDLTRFKTPDPWKYFYAKEALGVKTWDMYDLVLGAYGAELERLLSIGGDEEIKKEGDKGNSLRFKPVVKFLGPFYSDGKAQSQTFKMPNYVGSVRTMVVAAHEGAYGSTEKTTAVKNSLMVVATLPRVLGPDEEVKLPVNIFAMDNTVKNVSISVKTNDMLTISGTNTANVNFTKEGDQLVTFQLKVKPKVGAGKVTVTATSGKHVSTYEINIKVRVPNPMITNVIEQVIEPGQSWNAQYVPAGMAGTNRGTLEVSNIPAINLGQRLEYLIQYPHGCIEQTTSSVFPQLYLTSLVNLEPERKAQIETNIKMGIKRLQGFQTSDGGFAYWPGDQESDEWGSNYAGHFLLEAQAKGYDVPNDLLSRWLSYQKKNGQQVLAYNHDWQQLNQAYTLYTLALAGKPELSAMNRLKESNTLPDAANWRLAAAYVLAGQMKVAKQLTNNLATSVKPYRELDYSYGSDERDEAMILETMILLGERTKSAALVKELSSSLGNPAEWMSTQTTAYCLLAIGKFVGMQKANEGLQFSASINGVKSQLNKSELPLMQLKIKNANAAGAVSVQNPNKSILYVRLISEGIPTTGDQTEAENGLEMSIVYKTMTGKTLDPANMIQGTDFVAEVTVRNPTNFEEYKQMALTQIFPSGWEITNTRLDGTDQLYASSIPEYQDIRDDRVYTYFSLSRGETKTFRIFLNATYLGRFYLPTVSCEAMYDNTISARKAGKWVNVVSGVMVQ